MNSGKYSSEVFTLPERDSEQLQFLKQVSVQHVFAAGDPQSVSKHVCVKGLIQSDHCTMNPFALKIVCKLLKSKTETVRVLRGFPN